MCSSALTAICACDFSLWLRSLSVWPWSWTTCPKSSWSSSSLRKRWPSRKQAWRPTRNQVTEIQCYFLTDFAHGLGICRTHVFIRKRLRLDWAGSILLKFLSVASLVLPSTFHRRVLSKSNAEIFIREFWKCGRCSDDELLIVGGSASATTCMHFLLWVFELSSQCLQIDIYPWIVLKLFGSFSKFTA